MFLLLHKHLTPFHAYFPEMKINLSQFVQCKRYCRILYWRRHAKTYLGAYADSEGPDQTAHQRSLIRAFTVR